MRISRHLAFMQTAEVWARRSTCVRRNIGAVMVLRNNIISIAYNGPPAGEPHCYGRECASGGVCVRAVHAEINAINRTPIHYALDPAKVLYTTESPCIACASRIAEERIAAVYFTNLYRDPKGVEWLSERLPVYRMTPSGDVIDF